jgi:hypothetical protein
MDRSENHSDKSELKSAIFSKNPCSIFKVFNFNDTTICSFYYLFENY